IFDVLAFSSSLPEHLCISWPDSVEFTIRENCEHKLSRVDRGPHEISRSMTAMDNPLERRAGSLAAPLHIERLKKTLVRHRDCPEPLLRAEPAPTALAGRRCIRHPTIVPA